MRYSIVLILKFIVSLLLIPLVFTTIYTFHQELHSFFNIYRHSFKFGVAGYLITHLFIYQPFGFYMFGYRIISEIFRFIPSWNRMIPYFIPLYTVLLIIIYYFTSFFSNSGWKGHGIFMFLISFTLSMHLICSAQNLYKEDPNLTKTNYFFSILCVFVFNFFLLALLFSITVKGFDFMAFVDGVIENSRTAYKVLTHQFFAVLDKS